MPLTVAICLVVGIIIGLLLAVLYSALSYTERGGTLLINEKEHVYRFILNYDNLDEWGDEKFIILKVAKTETSLKRIQDLNPMNLEETDESI